MNTIEIFQSPTGEIEFRGDIENETVWASLDQIAKLFNRDKSGISRHIKNIYKSKELEEKATVAKIATVQTEGSKKVTRDIEYYNLDMILSIGYRVDSKEATELFANEKADEFAGIVGNLYQTFGGVELYPSIEDKASNLLYFIIKDHPFNDGNKHLIFESAS